MYIGLHTCKVSVILVRFQCNLKFDRFLKNTKISNFMKICSMGAELFHVDGWTDRHDKANSHFL